MVVLRVKLQLYRHVTVWYSRRIEQWKAKNLLVKQKSRFLQSLPKKLLNSGKNREGSFRDRVHSTWDHGRHGWIWSQNKTNIKSKKGRLGGLFTYSCAWIIYDLSVVSQTQNICASQFFIMILLWLNRE